MLYTPYEGENTGFDYSVTTNPTEELLTVGEIEDRMDLADNDDPDVIATQIKAVRAYLEKVLNMSLVNSKTITAYWHTFNKRIPLPFPPITSVTSVTRVAHADGTETALTSSEYWVEGVKNKVVNIPYFYQGYGLKIVYVTGLTDPAHKALVKDAIKSEVIEWYHQRTNPDETQYTLGRIALSKLNVLRSL